MVSGPAKRFYKKVEIGPTEGCEGFMVLLDGRGIRTPAGAPMAIPSKALAEGIAEEWDSQDEKILPLTMGLMRLAATTQDRVTGRRAEVIAEIVKFAETDLTCHRVETPADLATRQENAWQPELDWLKETYGVALTTTNGIMPVVQPDDATQVLSEVVGALNDWELTALHSLTGGLGSIVLGLSVLTGRLAGETAFNHSRLDELYQIEKWGEDNEALAARQAVYNDVLTTERFLALLKS